MIVLIFKLACSFFLKPQISWKFKNKTQSPQKQVQNPSIGRPALHEEISEHARYVHFSAVLPLCATLSKLVACCGWDMHSLLEPKASSTRGLFSRKVGLPAEQGCSSVRETSKQPVCRHVGCRDSLQSDVLCSSQ